MKTKQQPCIIGGGNLRGYGAIQITQQQHPSSSSSSAPTTIPVDHHETASATRTPLLVATASFAALLLTIVAASLAAPESSSSLSLLRSATTAQLAAMVVDDGRHHLSQDKWTPLWYKHQTVNHLDPHDHRTFHMKYFEKDDHFQGPGSPIFVVLGGEDPMTDLIIPFVYWDMAKEFGAATIGIEHRYFGDSYPVRHYTNHDLRHLLTPRQATDDFAQLIQWYRRRKGCSLDKHSNKYCPVITVGGSYPGFLSAMMRLDYPDVVDVAYASSAPLNLYGHHADPYAYFDHVTQVAEQAVPGCSAAVRQAVHELHDYVATNAADQSVDDYAKELRICKHGVPKYILENEDPYHMLWTEVNAIIVSHFAEANMGYYPPGPDTELEQACNIFLRNQTFQEMIGNFLTMRSDWDETGCFDMHSELPAGNNNATISASDWSGMGDGENALMWEFLSCQLLPPLSQGPNSMFYPRVWSEDWVVNKCQARFDYTPDFRALEKDFGFDNLTGVEHLLFVNGIRDGWSLMSITVPPPDSGIVVINVPNGAHCKDFYGPGRFDTLDMVQAHADIDQTIGEWLQEIGSGKTG